MIWISLIAGPAGTSGVGRPADESPHVFASGFEVPP